jgi:hypothetical protein
LSIETPERNSLQATALGAALAALQPIIALLLDAGINTNEVTRIVRWASVDEAAARQRRLGKKPSISRIAAATGLTRAEVSQLLVASPPTLGNLRLAPRASDKVIAAWLSDPDFLQPTGRPRPLTYSEGTISFSELVRRNASDIPPRALLNELLASRLVSEAVGGTYLPSPADSQSSLSEMDAIAAFGSKMNALGSTLLRNLHDPEQSKLYEALVHVASIGDLQFPKVARELARRCSTFSQAAERYLLDQADGSSSTDSDRGTRDIGVIIAVVERRATDTSRS